MSKGRPLLGAFLGAIIGLAFFAFSIWLSSITLDYLIIPFLAISWLIGGFFAGLIATTPGKGALAGFLTAIFAFIINSIIIIFASIFTGVTLFTVILEIISLGLFDSLVISAISAVFSIIAGLIGGAIRNPKKTSQITTQNPLQEVYR